ncbi:hypothetical protein OIU76_026773 [Salix suchowensis]|nr:hypothetical protein OIU78_023894 [Salix suchowensis]KAJ6372353.1 hypothetical protein OIU76_026773 [Salix suchowensis]
MVSCNHKLRHCSRCTGELNSVGSLGYLRVLVAWAAARCRYRVGLITLIQLTLSSALLADFSGVLKKSIECYYDQLDHKCSKLVATPHETLPDPDLQFFLSVYQDRNQTSHE